MKSYKVNTPHVVHEVFADEEAAIINLKTGNYYSLNPTASVIWTQIEKGNSSEDISELLFHTYEVDAAIIGETLQSFISILKDEDLIVENQNGEVQTLPVNKKDLLTKRPFSMPLIEKFADMQELLLLDPIHEVEDSGFPYQKN